jgi:arylsulfatase A-like enzyme
VSETAAEGPRPGLGQSLRAGLNAGALVGLLAGLLDGTVAAVRLGAPGGAAATLGSLAGGVLVYGLVWGAVLAAVGLALHPALARRELGERYRLLLGSGLGLALFLELYWWTRPWVFYGRSALAPERLAAAAALLVVALVLGRVLVLGLGRLPRGAQRGLPLVLWACWLVGALFLLAQRAPSARGVVNERTRELPNVLLVVVDALRADVLGCYGNQRVRTPSLDRLAERGVVFEEAWVQAPFTWSSFGSILTGKYPRRHGLVKMAPGVRMRPNVTLPWHLKSAPRLDGSRHVDEDWAAGTFLTGTLSHGSGLMRGFDAYFEALVGHELVELDRPWSLFRSELLLFRVKNKLTQKLDPSLVVDTATRWLARHEGRRFVAMVHLYSTHTPYDPPQRFREAYVDPAYDGPVGSFWAEHRIAIESGVATPSAADVEQIRNLYYGGVTQADHDIGILLAELERQGALDDTLVIVTADHGESLGEGGLWEHNHMVRTNLRVPLVMAWPAGLPAGVRVPALVESVDLLPTVCELLGLEPPADPAEGERGRIDGTSLVPLARGEVERAGELAFAENGLEVAVTDGRLLLVAPHAALEPGGWERALAGEPSRPRLYDGREDPQSLRDLFAPEHPELARLLEGLRAWNAAMPIPLVEVVRSTRDLEALEAAQRMRALGYTGEGIGGEVQVEDPRERPEEEAGGSR